MFRNNLKIAWRSLLKNRIYTGINIIGLTVGIASALLIYRIISYELSFNKQFDNYEDIVRVVMLENSPEGEGHSTCVPIPAMDVMENTVSQFKTMARVCELWATITIPNPNGGPPIKKFKTEDASTAFFAEPNFTDIFTFTWLEGDAKQALTQPSTIVLTRSWAEKCFDGWQNAMHKTLLLDNLIPLTVTGVLEDLPMNCDFNFPYLISYPTLKANADAYYHDMGHWGSCSSNEQVYAQLIDIGQWDEAAATLALVGQEEYNKNDQNRTKTHVLQPLSDLHYSKDYSNSGTHRTSRSRLRILIAIGILILIMACFNFINLSTAQSTLRSKEVGVRKTLGGTRNQLATQFISETSMVVLTAVILGASLASVALPVLRFVSNVPVDISLLSDPRILVFLGGLAVGITLLAGLYPAFSMANFKPIQALGKGQNANQPAGANLRKSLVIFQFMIAQGLIIAAFINILQLDYVQNKDLGFSQDLIYTFGFNNDSLSMTKQEGLKQRLLQIPAVTSVTLGNDQPISGNSWNSNFRYSSRPEDEPYHISLKFGDERYLETYGLRLVAGKWYAASDTIKDGVVNMTLIKKLGLGGPQEAIGQEIGMGRRKVKIVGVVEDFHTHSFKREYTPILLSTRKEYYWETGVKMKPTDKTTSTAQIQKVFDEVFPEQVFEGRFLDDRVAEFYENDRRLSAMTKGFGLLAILISCLGLFGLATHAATQRIKEIGIRKVLGASVVNILAMLSKDFVKMMLIALLIATPIAAYLMSSWLENFVFRIAMPWWVFIATGLIAITIALGTVSIQGIRAATVNPIKSLRDE